MKRVINGEVASEDFSLLHSESRASSTGAGHGSSRASPSRSLSKQSSTAEAVHGVSGASSDLHGESLKASDPSGASSSKVPSPSTVLSPSVAAPNWRSLLSTETKLQFVTPILKDGNKSVHIFKSVLDKGVSLWGDCLEGRFFGNSPKIDVIQSMIDKLWVRSGRVEVISLNNVGFMFKFDDPHTKTWVLEGAPGS